MEARAAPERELTSWHGGMVKGGHGETLLQVASRAGDSKHPRTASRVIAAERGRSCCREFDNVECLSTLGPES